MAVDKEKLAKMKAVANKSQMKVKEKKERKDKKEYPTVGVYISQDNKGYLEELYAKYPTIPRSRFFREFINLYKKTYGLDIPLDDFLGR